VHKTSTRNGYYYEVTVAGTASTEPAWTTTINATNTSGGVTFRCIGTIPTLYVPVSPSFVILKYRQSRMSVWDAIMDCVRQFGGDLRYAWRTATSQFELTLILPNRTKSVADFTWYPGTVISGTARASYLTITSLASGLLDVRNVIEGAYYDKSDLDASGQPKRKTYKATDATSQTKHGRQFMAFSEPSTSKIDTLAELHDDGERRARRPEGPADRPRDAAPALLRRGARRPLLDPGERDDAHRGAVPRRRRVSSTPSTAGEAATTECTFRGKPSASLAEWRRIDGGRSGVGIAPPILGPNPPASVTVSKVVGGLAVAFAANDAQRAAKHELHLYTTPGTTPSSATLKATTDSNYFPIPNLTPGVTFYGVIIPLDEKGNRGTASAEFSTAAGYTPLSYFEPRVAYFSMIPNSNFEQQSDAAAPPDGWSMVAGTWGTDAEIVDDEANAQSGKKYLRFKDTGATRTMISTVIPVRSGSRYLARTFVKISATTVAVKARVYWYTDLATRSQDTTLLVDTTGVVLSSWAYASSCYVAPSTAKYLAIEIEKNGAGAGTCSFDSLWFEELDQYGGTSAAFAPWSSIGAGGNDSFGQAVPAFANSWVNFGGGAVFDAAYRIDPHGRVSLRGQIKSGTVGAAAFVLPTISRPSKDMIFPTVCSGNVLGVITVRSNGNVEVTAGNNTEASLDGVSYFAINR
jgi:hypothetical protein